MKFRVIKYGWRLRPVPGGESGAASMARESPEKWRDDSLDVAVFSVGRVSRCSAHNHTRPDAISGAFEVPKDSGHLATLTAGYRRQRINFRLQRQAGYRQTLSKAILMVSKSFFWRFYFLGRIRCTLVSYRWWADTFRVWRVIWQGWQ